MHITIIETIWTFVQPRQGYAHFKWSDVQLFLDLCRIGTYHVLRLHRNYLTLMHLPVAWDIAWTFTSPF